MKKAITFAVAALLGTAMVVNFGDTKVQTPGPTYFAEIDATGTVLRVIVADQAFIDSGAVGDPNNWVQTYPDGSQKKHYAGEGYKYDAVRDAFIPPKAKDTDVFNEATAQWEFSDTNPKKPKEPK